MDIDFGPGPGEDIEKNQDRERSKREDLDNECKINGHDWLHIPLSDYIDCRRCGALDSMET